MKSSAVICKKLTFRRCLAFVLFFTGLVICKWFMERRVQVKNGIGWQNNVYNFSDYTTQMETDGLENMTNSYWKSMGPSEKKHRQTLIPEPEVVRSEEGILLPDSWQEILPDSEGKLIVYSAYYDDRVKEPVVRIMAVARIRQHIPIRCRLHSKEMFLFEVRGEVDILSEGHSYNHSAAFIKCFIPSMAVVPSWVSVTATDINNNTFDSMFLPVHFNSKNQTRKNFALCLQQPLHFTSDKSLLAVEFFEMYRILGIEHFFIYKDEVAPQVQKVLDHYTRLGLATVLPWKLSLKTEVEIHVRGQIACINDCIYRTMYRYNYTVMVDLDEYLIPTTPKDTYLQLMNKLDGDNVGAFLFQNFFFFMCWQNDTSVLDQFKGRFPSSTSLEDLPCLLTLFKTRRMIYPEHHFQRSKYIVLPESVIQAGIHFIHHRIQGYTYNLVPYDVASVQHYRKCFEHGECIGYNNTVDRTAWSYSGQLIPRVLDTCKQVFPDSGRCPFTPLIEGPPYLDEH